MCFSIRFNEFNRVVPNIRQNCPFQNFRSRHLVKQAACCSSLIFHVHRIFFYRTWKPRAYRISIAIRDYFWAAAVTIRSITNPKAITITFTPRTYFPTSTMIIVLGTHLGQRTLTIGYGAIRPTCMRPSRGWMCHKVKWWHIKLPNASCLFLLIESLPATYTFSRTCIEQFGSKNQDSGPVIYAVLCNLDEKK